jgi:uncharacterized membrane protein
MSQMTETKARTAIAWVLRIGSWVSTLVMALGLLILLGHGPTNFSSAEQALEPGYLLRHAFQGEPVALASLGILLLLLTPVLRIVVAAVSFGLERDAKYVLVSLGVLAIIVGSILLTIR